MNVAKPYVDSDLEMYPVSRSVNNPKNNGAALVDRIEENGM